MVETISGTVHTFCKNKTATFLCKECPRAAQHLEICGGTIGWENKLFYVSRFYVSCPHELIVENIAEGWTDDELSEKK